MTVVMFFQHLSSFEQRATVEAELALITTNKNHALKKAKSMQTCVHVITGHSFSLALGKKKKFPFHTSQNQN